LHGQRDPLAPDLMGCETVDPLTGEQDAPGGRPLESDDQLQERALAGPVRTDDGNDVAVVDPERYAVDGRETAEAFRGRVNLEKQIQPPPLRRGTVGRQRR
jgi:hypothetical protein